jgi:APA family basic amino acid/polyamine antiporter
MITVGSVIGSGIFLKPLVVAQNLPSAEWVYGVWAVLGIVCLCGAFAYGELGAMMPEAGGQYAFLREAYGRFVGFMYGWVLLLVINTGTLAALSVAFADTLSKVVPMGETLKYVLPMAMILLLAAVNHRGVGWGAMVQNLSTFAKLAALTAIMVGGFFLAHAGVDVERMPASQPAPRNLVAGLVAASVAIFWAYEGWYQLPFNAAELKDPRRDLPRGLLIGLVLLTTFYVLVNAAYLRVVPFEELRAFSSREEVPTQAVARIFGSGMGSLTSLMICLSVFGAANPNLLSTPRAFYAMAQDGLVPRVLMNVHPRYGTPHVAIWAQAVWAVLLVVVLRRFEDITDYVVFCSLLFYVLTVAAVFVLRHKDPLRERPFRCLGYPATPLLFILVVLAVEFETLRDPKLRINALKGLGILAAGIPVWFVVCRRKPA